MIDQARRGGQYMRRGAVILLQLDHFGFGKILFELQDIGDLRPAPAVDRLVVIADAADILVALREQPQPEILRAVGVLIFVDQYIFKLVLVALEYLAMVFEQVQRVQQQVAEITGVQRFQPFLIERVEMLALAIVIALRLVGIEILRVEAAVLPLVDQTGEHPGGPALVVDFLGLDQLLEQANLVVGVENGEIALQADHLGMAAQHFRADAVEGAEPRHAFETLADDCPDPLLHLAGGLVGERYRENLAGPGFARVDDMGDSPGQGGGLAGPRAGEHQHRALAGEHGLALRRVQSFHIGWIGCLWLFDRFGHG